MKDLKHFNLGRFVTKCKRSHKITSYFPV